MPELTPDAKRALRPLLESHGFDLKWSFRVIELPMSEGFVLSQ
jgi:hypothetical protein